MKKTAHFDDHWATMTDLYTRWDEGEITDEEALEQARASAKAFLAATEPKPQEPEVG